jgi:hypothetical protein
MKYYKKIYSRIFAGSLMVLAMLASAVPHLAYAAEYQRPPFELQGKMTVPDEYRSKYIAMHMFEGAWSSIKINVYKDYLSGYYRQVNPKDENHIVLLAITGKYERGYLVGTWEYSSVDQFEDKAHGPYPQVYEGSGTFVSGLIESKTENMIPANVEGTLTYNFGDLDPKGEPGKAAWIQREESMTFKARWEGKLQGTVCGGPDLDEYVGKAILTGRISKDWSGQAEIMHCGLADGSSPVVWQKVKDDEPIYVSDLLHYSAKGETHLETYQPDSLKENGLGATAGWSYSLGGNFAAPGFNPGSGVVSFLYAPRETKLGLVMGRLWTNTKSLLLEGTMKMETSQAAASIKGTNFILGSDDPRVTELMVLEGAVEFTAKADGKTVMVNAGQKAVATEEGMGEVESFDPAPLLADYKKFSEIPQPAEKEDYTSGPAPAGAPDGSEVPTNEPTTSGKSVDTEGKSGVVFAIVITLVIVVGGAWVAKRKKG